MNIDPGLLADSAVQMVNTMVWDIVNYLPNLVYAIVLLLVGYIVSGIIVNFIMRILNYLKFEKILQNYKVEDALGGNEISPILGSAIKLCILLLFIKEAVIALNLPAVAGFITSVILFAPALIGVGLLVIATAIIGEWIKESVLDMHKFYMQKTVAEVLKWGIVAISMVVALETIGFQMAFVREVFSTLLQGLVYGFAIAVGLAFGLGGQKDAQDMIKKARKAIKI